jgi:hypothetical protein
MNSTPLQPPAGFDSWFRFIHNSIIEGDIIQALHSNLQGSGDILAPDYDCEIHDAAWTAFSDLLKSLCASRDWWGAAGNVGEDLLSSTLSRNGSESSLTSLEGVAQDSASTILVVDAALSVLTSELWRTLKKLEQSAASKAVVEAVQARETCIMIRKGITADFSCVKGGVCSIIANSKRLTVVAGQHGDNAVSEPAVSAATAVSKGSGISLWLEGEATRCCFQK